MPTEPGINGHHRLRQAKALFICHSYASFTKDQIEAVASQYDHIDVLVRYKPIAEISSVLPFGYFERHRKKRSIDLRNKPAHIRVIPTPLFYLPTDAGYKRLGEKHLRSVEKAIQRYNIQFDLIHAHFTWSAGYVGARLRERYKVPFVVTAHGYDIYDLPFRDSEWRKKIEYVLNAADRVITVSKSNYANIGQLNVKTPVQVITNGFRRDVFSPRDPIECKKRLNLPLDKRIVLTVGNLVQVKGHTYLVESLREILNHRRDVLLFIVGSGRLEHKLRRQIQRAGLEDHVKLAGGKPHNEIATWMNACDVFVLPSLRESFGVVQIEAMACGKPVVATYNGGSEEVVTLEDYGCLVEPANAQALAEGILAALNKEWNGEKILQYAEQFAWKNIAEHIVDVYADLVPCVRSS